MKYLDKDGLTYLWGKIKSKIPTKTSDLTNDSGYLDSLVILSYGNSTWTDFINAYNKNAVVYCRASSNSNPASGSQTRMAFMAYVNNATTPTNVEFQYYRSVSSHSASQQGDQVFIYKLDKTAGWTVTTREAMSKIATGTGLTSSYSNGTITLSTDLSTVATSGSYNDLSDKPTIPSEVTESTVSGWGFTKNTGTYSKPSGGIPKTDLASAVQTSLGKADTALQSYTETDPVFTASAAHDITSTDITNWNNKSDFSGSYNDLTNKPTIPTVNNATLTIQKNGTTVKTFTANASSNVTANITVPTKTSDLTNDSGYTTNTGTITSVKMNGSTVASSGEADLGTVLTSHQSIKTINSNTITGTGNVSVGTITKVQANGTDVASSGTANIPAATTGKYGVTKLSSATNSTSTTLAATPSAVKSAYDLATTANSTANSKVGSWIYWNSTGGSNILALPSSFKELLIIVYANSNNSLGSTFNIPYDALDTTATRSFNNGYYWATNFNMYVRIGVTTNDVSISAARSNNTDVISNSSLFVYYR